MFKQGDRAYHLYRRFMSYKTSRGRQQKETYFWKECFVVSDSRPGCHLIKMKNNKGQFVYKDMVPNSKLIPAEEYEKNKEKYEGKHEYT